MWHLVFRDIANATNERTGIAGIVGDVALSNKAPAINFRKITRATDERTAIAFLGDQPAGNSTGKITFDDSEPADISRDDAMALLDKAAMALLETRARFIMDDFNEHRRRKAAEQGESECQQS